MLSFLLQSSHLDMYGLASSPPLIVQLIMLALTVNFLICFWYKFTHCSNVETCKFTAVNGGPVLFTKTGSVLQDM